MPQEEAASASGRETADGDLLGWCVVANVVEHRVWGEEHEVRRGIKHFAPGAKVWVLPPQWGDGGEKVFVVGRHCGRGRRGFIRMVVPRRHLTGFRVRGVYSPAVHRELTRPWQPGSSDHPMGQWESQEATESAAGSWNDTDEVG